MTHYRSGAPRGLDNPAGFLNGEDAVRILGEYGFLPAEALKFRDEPDRAKRKEIALVVQARIKEE